MAKETLYFQGYNDRPGNPAQSRCKLLSLTIGAGLRVTSPGFSAERQNSVCR
jgi:hypothetical protein